MGCPALYFLVRLIIPSLQGRKENQEQERIFMCSSVFLYSSYCSKAFFVPHNHRGAGSSSFGTDYWCFLSPGVGP